MDINRLTAMIYALFAFFTTKNTTDIATAKGEAIAEAKTTATGLIATAKGEAIADATTAATGLIATAKGEATADAAIAATGLVATAKGEAITTATQLANSAESAANNYTQSKIDDVKESIGAIETTVNNIAVYAENSSVVPFNVATGNTALATLLGTLSQNKAVYVIPVSGTANATAVISNGGTTYDVDNGDVLYVTCSEGEIVSVSQQDSRVENVKVELNDRIYNIVDGVDAALDSFKTQMETQYPGVVLV